MAEHDTKTAGGGDRRTALLTEMVNTLDDIITTVLQIADELKTSGKLKVNHSRKQR